jgi:hypothetical protein
VLVIALDSKRRRARLVRKYTHRPGRLVTKFMGNAQVLENGNVLVGWGNEPYITEFDAEGAMRFDAALPPGGMSYRAFRFSWAGRPGERPRLVSRRAGGKTTLFVSWNGATEAVAWQLRAGPSRASLQPAVTRPKTGFETALAAPAGAGYAAAVALGRHGKALGTSNIVRF